MPITVKPLEPFAVEVRMDVKDPRNVDVLRDLFQKYGLLVFREQSMTIEEQVRLMGLFGPVVDDWTGTGYVSNVRPDGILGTTELCFHQDLTQTVVPFLGLSLLAVDVENDATSTLFASGERAYLTMPVELRHQLRRRQVQNLWSTAEDLRNGRRRHGTDFGVDFPGAVLDVFMIDPITGRHAVSASPMVSERIVGVSREESDRLLDELFAVQYAPENVYEHRWRMGDLVIWSNLAFCHARSALPSTRPRTLQRVCIGQGTQEDYRLPDEFYATAQYHGAGKG